MTVVAALTFSSSLADAGKKQKKTLAQGVKLYQDASYEEALFILEELAARAKLENQLEAEALKYVAFCYYLLGATEQAKDTWSRLRKVAPKLELDPLSDSPEIADFFTKLDAAAGTSPGGEPAKSDDGKGGEPGAAKDEKNGKQAPAAEAGVRGCGVLLCLLPVGVGQFANGQIIWGIIFAVLEPVFLGLNVAFWYMNDIDKVRQPNGPDRYRDLALANQRYTYQMVFFGLTVGTVVIGIVNAFLYY